MVCVVHVVRVQHEAITRRTAVCCGEHFVTKKWIGGTLTNNMETIGEQLVPDLMIMCGLPVLRTAVKVQTHARMYLPFSAGC